MYGDTKTRSVTIDSDLSDSSYLLVNLDTGDDLTVNLATDSSAPVFVLVDDGDGSSTSLTGSIAVGGRVKVKLGGTVAPGDKLTATTAGKAIKTVTDTQHYGFIALVGGVTGDLVEALVAPGMVAA